MVLDMFWMEESYTAYLIEYHGKRIYFGGDTGYDSTFFVETGR
jgi:N-acyl-phosphatidylethanolamine-hydrolysing phospholipase D